MSVRELSVVLECKYILMCLFAYLARGVNDTKATSSNTVKLAF